MNKKHLISIIEKVHLGGLTEQIRLKIKDNELNIDAAVILKDCIIKIKAPFELPDSELGIYDLTQLYKLVSITNDPLELEVIEKDGKAMKLDIKDNQFDLSYNLGDLGLISEGKLSNQMPDPSIVLTIDQEFITRFIKAHNALQKVETFTIKHEIDKLKIKNLKFTIGLKERYANKITFNQPTEIYNEIPVFTYNVANFREIISNNKDSDIKMYVYPMGIVSLITKEDDIEVQYWVVPLKQ